MNRKMMIGEGRNRQ